MSLRQWRSPLQLSPYFSPQALSRVDTVGRRHGRRECPGQAVLVRVIVRLSELRVVVEELYGLDAVVHALRPLGVSELVDGRPQSRNDLSHGPPYLACRGFAQHRC